MRLRLGEAEIDVAFLPAAEIVSQHSRRALQTGTLVFAITDPNLFEGVEAAKAKRGIITLIDDDGTATMFQITSGSYSFSGVGPPWNQRIEVVEAEPLTPTAVTIDGLTVEPYYFEEEAEPEGITVRLSVEGRSTLEQLKEKVLQRRTTTYFDVVRKGIEDAPRQMRFGRGFYWSEKGGVFRVELVLVEKSLDETPDRFPDLLPEYSRLIRRVARTSALFDVLADKLLSKGVLTEDDLTNLRREADSKESEGVWHLHQIDEVRGPRNS